MVNTIVSLKKDKYIFIKIETSIKKYQAKIKTALKFKNICHSHELLEIN